MHRNKFFLQQLNYISHVDWLIFIANKRTDTHNFNSCETQSFAELMPNFGVFAWFSFVENSLSVLWEKIDR